MTFGKEHQLIGVSNNCLYEWDLRTYKAINMQRKCLAFTKVTVCDDVLATGNKLGIVQLSKVTCDAHDQRQYDDYSEVSNLVTYVTEMKTDPRSRFLLAMSRWKPNAARLINIHKGKCIPNWPNVKTKVGFGICAGFSSSDQLAIGSSHGYATIYNLL